MDETNILKSIAEKAIVTSDSLRAANDTLNKYKAGKAHLDQRIIENEDWWKLQHRRYFRDKPIPEAHPTSAWLFNSIMNKHADIMDNYPSPVILPREQSDDQTASILQDVIPVVLENCDFEQTYSDNAWVKLKVGASVYGVFWDSKAHKGLGDIAVRPIDILQFYWEPGVKDLQDSRNIFLLSLADNDTLKARYPQLEGKLSGNGIDVKKYNYDDTVDTTNKSIVVDWYYKVDRGAGAKVHYVKYVGEEVLFASENEAEYRENGFYNHGMYPFVMDVLFKEEGTPCGFGFIDVMKSPQEYIDKLGGAMLDNAMWNAKPRWFSKDGATINEEEYLDLSKPFIHVAGSVDDTNIRSITVNNLPGSALQVYQDKVNELKETSGNRDIAQGTTTSGVTAASAISILTENSSKGSRDMIKGSYRAFQEICELVIELIRQFYDTPRTFRIVGDRGQQEFVQMTNVGMQPQTMMEYGMEFQTREPVFDIKVKAQKANPYAQISQNELAIQFFNMGFFNPQFTDQALGCIEMMEFEGKDKLKERIEANGTMAQKLQQAQQLNVQLAQALASATGDTRPLQALQMTMGQEGGQPVPSGEVAQEQLPTDSLGNSIAGNGRADKARRQANESTTVK